jgi:hypothetical protein
MKPKGNAKLPLKNINNEMETIQKHNTREIARPNKLLNSILFRTSLPPVYISMDVSIRICEHLSPKYFYWGASLTEKVKNKRKHVVLTSRLVYLNART